MQCVILAGGLATRMQPFTATTPKWLLPVAGRPFAHWQLEWLSAAGVDSVVCCIGHLGENIREAIGTGSDFGLRVEYSDDGPSPSGTGGALRQAAESSLLEDRFLVLYGDSYLRVDITSVWQAFLTADSPALMTVFRNEGAFDTSNVLFSDGRVLRYRKAGIRVEAPAADQRAPGVNVVDSNEATTFDYIDYGLSALRLTELDELARGVAVDLALLFESLSDSGLLAGYEATERFYEIGTPEGLHALELYLQH